MININRVTSSNPFSIDYVFCYWKSMATPLMSWYVSQIWYKEQTQHNYNWGGVTKLVSSVPLFSDFFQNIRQLLNITFIFQGCHCSSAAGTYVKYERDLENLTGNFARSKCLLTEKLANGALVTPTPGPSYLNWFFKATTIISDVA